MAYKAGIAEIREAIRDLQNAIYGLKQEVSDTQMTMDLMLMTMRTMHLPPQVERAIATILRVKRTIELLVNTIEAAEAAILGGPIGWIYAGIAGTRAVVMAVNSAQIAMEMSGGG